MNKKTFGGVAGAVVGVSALVGAFIVGLSGEKIEGSYYVYSETPVSSRITIYLPYDSVPNATYYSLAFNDSEFGLSTFASLAVVDGESVEPLETLGPVETAEPDSAKGGSGGFSLGGADLASLFREDVNLALEHRWGVSVANVLLDPISSLESVVYNQNRQPIGHGRFLDDGRVLFEFQDSEVVK